MAKNTNMGEPEMAVCQCHIYWAALFNHL